VILFGGPDGKTNGFRRSQVFLEEDSTICTGQEGDLARKNCHGCHGILTEYGYNKELHNTNSPELFYIV